MKRDFLNVFCPPFDLSNRKEFIQIGSSVVRMSDIISVSRYDGHGKPELRIEYGRHGHFLVATYATKEKRDKDNEEIVKKLMNVI